jgi:hypothetical protein
MSQSQNPINLEIAKNQLNTWLAANLAVASGQAYEIEMGGTKRKLTRVNSKEILEQIKFWSKEIALLESGQKGIQTKYVIPREDL